MEAWALQFDQPVPYARGLAIQEAILELRIQDKIPDTFLFLEHPPVITLGRRGRNEHLLHAPDFYAKNGIDLVTASRGGDVTFHGPGQQVLYPILKLGANEQGAHGYLGATGRNSHSNIGTLSGKKFPQRRPSRRLDRTGENCGHRI